MRLQPCSGCARHVDVREVACPFCRTIIRAEAPPSRLAGRFARAAVFAGATLAGCDQGKPPDTTEVKQFVVTPRIYGEVVDQTGAPVIGARVTAHSTAQTTKMYETVTDNLGRFEIKADPDTYIVGFAYSQGHHRGSTQQEVTLMANTEARLRIPLDLVDEPPMMPYGAPPARRRSV